MGVCTSTLTLAVAVTLVVKCVRLCTIGAGGGVEDEDVEDDVDDVDEVLDPHSLPEFCIQHINYFYTQLTNIYNILYMDYTIK